ncbi:MAG: hypothetical protein VYB10_00770 [Actinomycetota bacterium]|nr:hypothetical protein [Actinomycetota bacterium]
MSIGVWILWVLVLGSSMIRRPWGLTVMRIVVPAALPASLVANSSGNISIASLALAIAHVAAACVLALLPETGNAMVDGLSYGDERRFLLRAPGAVLLGPLPVVWALVVLGVVSGPLLIASENWVIGIVLTGVGWPVAVLGFRSLHQLTRRWVVFVPNGFVIHDYLAAREPFLLRRQDLSSLGPAAADLNTGDADLIDISQLAPGPVLQVALHGEVEVVPRGRGTSEVRVVKSVLFSPTRPGAVLREARSRNLVR